MKKIEGLQSIMLIDDDEATNFIHKVIIKKLDLDTEILVAMNGLEALEILQKKGQYADHFTYPQPGLILLDINMPVMNGWEFLEAYKLLPKEQQGKIVVAMLTTSLNPDDRKRARTNKKQLSEFMNKPLTKENLSQLLEKYFDLTKATV